MIDNNMRVKTIGKIENINRKAGVVADIDSIRGGRLIVADKKQLSLIPVEKCKVGMVIYVQSENKEYTLIQEPTGTIYTDSADWEVKKTNAEDVYVQNGSKQTSVVEDYTTKINAITTQTLETIAANYTPKTEFEQQMNAATARITTVEERSTNNASRLDAVETNISANAANLQKLNDDVFGTERNDGLKQDIDKKIEQANDSIAAMSDNIKTNQNDIRSLTQKVTTNGESISAINSEITNNIKADISDIKKNIGDYNISQQFKTVADQISNANANANTQHNNLQTSINRVNNRLAAYKESTNQTIDEYGDKLKEVEKTASDNKDALKDTIGNLSDLSEQVTRNYGDFETLNTTVNDPVNGLSIQCTKLNNQFTKLYGDYNLNNSVSLSSIVENISKNATNIAANTESINGLKTDKSAFLEDSGLSKDSATAQTLYNATLYTLKGFINTHEISDIEKRDAKETTIIGNIVANAKAIDAVKASIKTNSDNIDKNTQSISYLNETAKSLKLQPVIEDISSDKSTGEVKVKLDIENIKMTAFQYMTLGIAGRTKEDKTTSSTWVPNSSSEYFGIASSLLTDEEGNTNMVTVRGYITPQNAAAEDQIYLESDPMDLTKEFSISYGFIKPETKTINGNTYHQYVELGKTKIHFFDDDGVTIKIKLPDKISDDDANADDSVKLAIGFTNVDNREADVADSCFAFSLAGAFEATSLDGATEDGGLYIIRSNKAGDAGEIVNHGSFAITSNAIRRAGEVGFVTVFQI